MRPHRAARVAVLLALATAGRVFADDGPPVTPPTPVGGVLPPQVRYQVEAAYPPEAEAAGLEGTVKLELTIDSQGILTDAKVVGPAGHGFDEAALAAVRQFKFWPAVKDHKPIPIRVIYEYHFTLKKVEKPVAPTTGTLRGVVVDDHGRPLAGVTVDVIAKGDFSETSIGQAQTGPDGGFVIPDLPPGGITVRLTPGPTYVASEVDEAVTAGQEVTVRYALASADSDNVPGKSYETIVRGRPRREEISRRSISIAEITRIPGVQGDAIRAVENFPGVARPTFNNGQLIVRGSAPEDTAVYIQGFWVPLVYHFGGLTSIINSDILAKVDFLPGNFSARYGRATGGIIDVDTRAPKRKWTGYVDANFIDAKFLVEGPLGSGSIALAGRRSYVDAYLGLILPKNSGFDFTSAPVYYDYQALYDNPKFLGGKLTLLWFGDDDRLKLLFDQPSDIDPAIRGSVSTGIDFHRLHAIWARRLGHLDEVRLSAALGWAKLGFKLGPEFDFSFNSIYTGLRTEWTHRISRGAKLTVGYEHQVVPYHVFVQAPRPPQEGQFPAQPLSGAEILKTDRTGSEYTPALYAELEYKAGKLTLYPSTRFDYTYSSRTLDVSPRLNARYEASPATTVKGGVGLFHQPPQPWETDPSFGNPSVRDEQGLHVSLGAEHKLPAGWQIEGTAFFKYLTNLIVRSDQLTLRDGRVTVEGYANEGKGRVYGGELLLRHELSHGWFAWLSYTLMKSQRQDHPGEPYRLFDFDQTHILALVASKKWGKGWQAGARFRFVTGDPQTAARGGIYDADGDVYIPIPGPPNTERLPPFHQLDVRVDKEWRFRTWAFSMYLDVQNVYSRLNAEGTFYSFDYSKRSKVSGLPIIPSLGFRGEF
jgi:TonB family protein